MEDPTDTEVQEQEEVRIEMEVQESEEVRIATELVYQMMERAPATAAKALHEIQSNLSSRKLLTELMDAAEKLVNDLREADGNFVLPSPTAYPMLNLLLLRCEDERVNTRKGAISAMEQLFLRLADPALVGPCLDKLKARCRDLSLAVRKHAADSMTRLLDSAIGADEFQDAWLRYVMLLITDRELTVQQMFARLFLQVVVTPIRHGSGCVVWKLLSAIEKEVELRRLFLRCIVFLSREKNLPSQLAVALNSRVATDKENASACWMVLSELSAFQQVSPARAVEVWCNDLDLDQPDRIVLYLAKILANRADELDAHKRNFLKERIKDALQHHRVHPTHISAVYYAFARICDAIGEEATGKAQLNRFNKDWYSATLRELDTTIYDDSGDASELDPLINEMTEDIRRELTIKIVKLISSIGEAVQYTPSLIDKPVFKLLKVLIASDVLKELSEDLRTNTATTPTTMSPTRSAITGERLLVRSGALSDRGTTASNFITRVYNRTLRTDLMTRVVRSHAVLTLGKLCLQDEKLAKKCVPVFVRQLKVNNDHFVRNNIVVVVCDLCIRYTLLVDRYSTILASCLKDNSVLVRHQTLVLLTNLIKEQYLKWEGPIIYRFVTALLDPEPCIRQYAEFCLVDILLIQFPTMFFHHFIECLFYFNDVKHESWAFRQEGGGDTTTLDEFEAEVSRKCALEGDAKFDSRMVLYKFMLNRFTDEERLKASAKLASEVFQPLVEGGLNMEDAKTRNLLVDSFEIMRSNEMKLQLNLGQRDVNDEADDEEPPEAVKDAARKVIAQVFRKTIIEAVMPHLVTLRQTLTERRDPLLNLCYSVLLEFYKDHKEQLDDYLASDPQLRSELQFDLRRQRGTA